MSTDIDPYRTLQVDPHAEDVVVEAAFRALARRYHPDGEAPDHARMAAINRAYNLVRNPVLRRKYDRDHHLRPVGPGLGTVAPPPTATPRATSPATSASKTGGPQHGSGNGATPFTVLDFGRYAGWTLKDLAKHDPDYLRWLARSSGGVRYRHQILRLLPDAPEVTHSI